MFTERPGRQSTLPVASPDGALLAIGVHAKTGEETEYAVEVWAIAPPKRVWRFAGLADCVRALRFSPDGRTLAVGDYDGDLTLFDARTGERLGTHGEPFTVSTLAFHPTRPYLVFGTFQGKGKANLRVMDVPTGKVIGSARVDPFGVYHLDISPDGKWLATAGGDGEVRVWELEGLIGK